MAGSRLSCASVESERSQSEGPVGNQPRRNAQVAVIEECQEARPVLRALSGLDILQVRERGPQLPDPCAVAMRVSLAKPSRNPRQVSTVASEARRKTWSARVPDGLQVQIYALNARDQQPPKPSRNRERSLVGRQAAERRPRGPQLEGRGPTPAHIEVVFAVRDLRDKNLVVGPPGAEL